MSDNGKLSVRPTLFIQNDVCLIYSGSAPEQQLDNFLRQSFEKLKLKLGPMNYDRNDIDAAIFNDNLKTIKNSKFALLTFCKSSRKSKRCRFERLFALHIHVHSTNNRPVLIPITIGDDTIPEKYSMFQEVAIEQSNDWTVKLLKALTLDIKVGLEQLKEAISSDEKKLIEQLFDDDQAHQDYQEDLDELDTAFDQVCFNFLDDFVKEYINDNDKSAELDAILKVQSELSQKLEQSSLKTSMAFLKINSETGIASYVGQMGLNNIHWNLMKGCGMTISEDQITLKWKTFEQNLLFSSITVANIENFSKYARIKRIALQFDKESHEKISEYYGKHWQSMLVQFADKILQRRFSDSEKEMLIYRVLFSGIIELSTMHAINKSCRRLQYEKFVDHTRNFNRLEDRLKTYDNWSGEWNTLELAEAGFIYSGHGDVVTCFTCNQSLYGVTSVRAGTPHHEDAGGLSSNCLKAHCYWNESCPFLQSLPNFEDIRKQCAAQNRLSSQESSKLVKPKFSSILDRLKTFDKSLPEFRCQTFAEAGFFQQFFDEDFLIVRCFLCTVDITVKLSQDPWIVGHQNADLS